MCGFKKRKLTREKFSHPKHIMNTELHYDIYLVSWCTVEPGSESLSDGIGVGYKRETIERRPGTNIVLVTFG